jgi:phage terminase large subunit
VPLNHKQEKSVAAFRSGKYKYICHAGTAGSGKTFLDLGLLHLLCCKIPGVRFFIGRKTEKNLRQTTIPSYNEMKRKSKSIGESEIVNMTAKYNNGSEILFIWCDIAKDPDLNNLRGLEVNGGLFEEANQIDKKYFEVAKTRVGRWRPELCPAFIMLNLNPSAGWVKDLFYDNWVAGTLPENYYFEEFDEEDAKQCSGEEYVKGLYDLAPEELDRFVKNKWNYSVAANQLINFEWYKNCMRIDDPMIAVTDRALGVTDPAWEGDDSTVFARMHGNHIGWWEEYDKQDPDISGALAHEQVKMFGIKERDWIIDPVGIGSATVLKMRNDCKYEPDMFYGGTPATNMFGVLEIFNQRSEAHWLLREAMRAGEITFTHHPDFQEQCLAAKYFIDDKKIRIIDKKAIKKDIGMSPGRLDCAMMLIHKWKTESGGEADWFMARQLDDKEISTSRAQRERMAAITRSKEID